MRHPSTFVLVVAKAESYEVGVVGSSVCGLYGESGDAVHDGWSLQCAVVVWLCPVMMMTMALSVMMTAVPVMMTALPVMMTALPVSLFGSRQHAHYYLWESDITSHSIMV